MAGEMEHPGKYWNRIETWGNKVLDRFLPAKALRWCWGVLQALLSLLLAMFTLQATLGVACINIVMVHYLTAERIISCGNAAVNPQNEGKLIKIQGKLTHSEPVHDPVLNVRIDAPCARRVFDPNYEGIHSLKTRPPILDTLRTGPSLLSTETSIGAYRILNHAHDVLLEAENLAGVEADALEAAITIQNTMIKDGDLGLVPVNQLAIKPDFHEIVKKFL